MSGNAAMESSLDILSRAAVAAGIMDKRFKDENAPPPASPSSSEASETSLEVASYTTNVTEDEVKRRVETSECTDVAIASKSASGPRSSIIVYAESDTPLDMSVKKHLQKRKWSSTELCEHQDKDGEIEGASHKRKRPSVITCGNRNVCHSCDPGDVDDHFRKSLGLDYYNWVFNRAKKMLPGVANEASGSSSKACRNGQDRSAAFLSPGKKNSRGKKQDIPASLKVDEHFAKSLGTLTWMRLQGR